MPINRAHLFTKRSLTLVAVIIFVVGAGAVLVRSHADTAAVSLEAESGQLSGSASLLSDTDASGGRAIVFGAAATAPPPAGAPSCAAVTGNGATINVSNSSQFTAALATAQAGDTIALSGNYSTGMSITGKSYAGAPLIIKAATPLGATLNSFTITSSNNIVLEGFMFGPNSASTYMKVASSTNIQVLRNVFDSQGVSTNQTSLITSGNSDTIAIGCNEFRNRYTDSSVPASVSGSYIKTQYDAPDMTKHLHVYRNYFHGIGPALTNGVPAGDSDREAIAMGISASQNIVTNNLVEYNLYEDCDGENEIMTIKTSNNIFRNNTFKNSMGSLSLREGANNQAYDNYFYGVGASASITDPNYQTGGIRAYGTGHIIRDNVMNNLTGDSWRLPILIDSGDTTGNTSDSHQAATNIQVTGNTILNSTGGINVGSSNYNIKPSGITVSGNTVSASRGNLFYDIGSGGTWSGNKAYATGSGVAVGGIAKSASEVQLLTGAPSVTLPTPLASSDVGPNAQ